jgi:thiaminase/transcriptional activator TenA
MVADRAKGPVGDFCEELAMLQRNSPLSRAALARILNYGRSQLYEILDGRIKRPPEWDRLVEPLVRACLAGNPDSAAVERTVTEWRHRHEILVRVWEELSRRDAAAQQTRASASENLAAHAAEWWPALFSHRFIADVAAGTLDAAAFRRWMVDDHYFNVEYQRFVAGLAAIAPDAEATESIASAVSASHLGLYQVRRLAARSFIDVTVEPSLTAIGFAGYLQAQVARGYEPALAALYASEKVYYDLWSSVRSVADRTTPYWHLVEHWSAEPYGMWIARLGELVDSVAPGGLAPDTYRVFDRVVRFELAFFTTIHTGHP